MSTTRKELEKLLEVVEGKVEADRPYGEYVSEALRIFLAELEKLKEDKEKKNDKKREQ